MGLDGRGRFRRRDGTVGADYLRDGMVRDDFLRGTGR